MANHTTESAATGFSVIDRVLGWLTDGYPDGIPSRDRFAVIAVLKRRLTDDQILEIVAELTVRDSPALTDGEIGQAEVEELITRVLQEQPSAEDVHRVSARLAAGGWPLADELEIAAGTPPDEPGEHRDRR
ncbi:DUF3349 domain-containing protein [Microlunatus elymi]|uniref:DUF3349 domain-containing protein n=1 Tax=Microlunatus elymi TaxID=2596828 RepID=A0A516Q0R0_9ACTN|nr:DUF3349 domain-containing protein [Microlunatus elymi]QDP97019.1 DUF3349 domain-containing protein [Microlunatus elymi]